MAGHSQFKNIMHRKGAQDKKKAKMLSKIAREIIAACKVGGGGDPASNPRLRSAIQWARQENMPRDKIEAAIKRGSGDLDTDNYDPIRYEGYGVAGVAIIVETLTDNRNRTASDVRSTFSKHNGNMGEAGSVSFMFDHVGVIVYPDSVAPEDKMFEAALEAGADECAMEDGNHIVTCAMENFGSVQSFLEKKYGEPTSAKLVWRPQTTTTLNEEQADSLLKLIEALEDNDDVQEVFANFEIPDDVMEKLSA